MNNKFLNEAFESYYKLATDAYNSGNKAAAKRNMMLAAENLLKLAQGSDGELKRARMERAARIIEAANRMGEGSYRAEGSSQGAPMSAGGINRGAEAKGGGSNKKDDGEGVAEWSEAKKPNIKFSDIAGLDDVKKSIETRVILPLKHPEIFKSFDKKTGGGILLYGPPGTGKTMLAKAAATEIDAKFFAVSCSDIVSKYLGEAERKIKSLFETARAEESAIIFFDEFEAIAKRRGEDNHDAMNRLLTELLVQFQGFTESDKLLLYLAATNRPWDIDPALLRPGRFSEHIYVPLPDAAAREFLLNKKLKKLPLEGEIDMAWLLEMTEGYSGADIDELCDRVKEGPLRKSIEQGEIVKITLEDFKDTFNIVRPSVKPHDLLAYKEFIDGTIKKKL